MKPVRKRGLFSRISVDESSNKCFHGPKLLFEKKNNKSSFYRCSAFRSSHACKKDENSVLSRTSRCILAASSLLDLPRCRRAFCHSCQLLVIKKNDTKHDSSHRIVQNLSRGILSMPTYLLEPLVMSSEHAQYFFSLDFLNFMMSTLALLGIDTVLCVGAPRLFDFLRIKRRDADVNNLRTFLLDLDFRLEQFYPRDDFAHFNMLNYHFFSEGGHDAFEKFINTGCGRCVIFCDPPFAAPLTPLMAMLEKLKKSIVRSSENLTLGNNIFLFLILPYYYGRKLQQIAPTLRMLDYRVTYENHGRLTDCDSSENKNMHGRRRISVVRIFTDLAPKEIPPPYDSREKFRFCNKCQRYSYSDNFHCEKCNACTTLHGASYVHCDKCGLCKPPSYSHCDVCNKCILDSSPSHACGSEEVIMQSKRKRRKK